MIEPDSIAFADFLSRYQEPLHKIVGNSRGQWTLGDIPGETLITAFDLHEELGRPLDFGNAADARLLLRKLRSAAYAAGGVLRNARRPDQASSSADAVGERAWDRYLIDDGDDALSLLVALETPDAPEPPPIDPYHSESAAWNWLWHRFQRSTRDIAAFLMISASWCRQRRTRAFRNLAHQEQLPHRMRIQDDETAIQPWRKFKLPVRIRPDNGQLGLDFWCKPAQPEHGQLWLL